MEPCQAAPGPCTAACARGLSLIFELDAWCVTALRSVAGTKALPNLCALYTTHFSHATLTVPRDDLHPHDTTESAAMGAMQLAGALIRVLRSVGRTYHRVSVQTFPPLLPNDHAAMQDPAIRVSCQLALQIYPGPEMPDNGLINTHVPATV